MQREHSFGVAARSLGRYGVDALLARRRGQTANSLLKNGKEEQQMRRVTMMLAAMAVMVPLFAGVAYAANIEGTSAFDILLDSQRNDTIFGRGAGDGIFANAFGPDGFITVGGNTTGPDRDEANGNGGNDFINTDDGDGRDTANGGSGNDDVCVIDANDTATSSCETVEEDPPTTVAAEPVVQ
jgi:hypothetical protein